MMNKIFPTFEEIKDGYCVYEKSGAYKGLDDDGNPIFSRRLAKEVSIDHGWYNKYITIDIILDRKFKKVGFHYGYDNKMRSRHYSFTESGYAVMLADIKKDLEYDSAMIKKLIADLERRKIDE